MEDLSGLIIAARNGDSPAFEELVRRFQDMAVGYAYSILGDWHEAEDAAQDAFVSAYCSLIQLRDAAAFPGWFRRIVYTQSQRRLRVKAPAWVSLEQVSELAVAGPAPSAEAVDDAELWALVDSLPEAQRSVLLLYYMRDFSQKEIAAFLDIPLGTVKTRLHHARKRLKERMRHLNDISAKRPSRDGQFTEKIMRLFEAAKTGDIEGVRGLLAQDGRLANASGYVRSSLWASDALALHVAVMHGRKDIVDLLLAHGADIKARDEKYGFNALIHAIDLADFMPEYAALGMVDFLLERGAEKDVWACAWLGDGAGVDAWLQQDPALVNQVGPGPSTLLSFCRDVKAIQYYLDHGADPLVPYERSGKYGRTTPLRDIAYRRNYDCVRHLLAHLGWEIDIFWAGIMGDRARARDLLAEDAALVNVETAADHVLGGGLSPLHLAAQGGHIELMAALLEAGADINARDASGYTPLHFVICFGPKEFLDPLPDLTAAAQDVGVYRLLTDVPRFLLEQGADLMAREAEESRTPLELARSAFEDETDRGDVIALLEAAEAQGHASDGPGAS
ncbi:MAG: sigma-70 family RNA polymerase sigma factor [Anaerolineae bacterium]|nr:sigma-70 family RNA polymerase sigma factor [Anaerolineae bacterium]